MRNLLLIFILPACWWPATAQVNIPLQTFIAGGVAAFPSGSVSSFGTVGQPIFFPRNTATSPGGGVAVAADLMFSDIAIDNNPPSFVGTPTITVTKATGGITGTLTANATDAESTPRVYMYHRPIAGGGSYDSTLLSGTGPFTLDVSTLGPTEYDNMGIEYYLKAFDSRPNVARHPASGTLFARVVDPDAKVPAALLSYGNQVSNYRMIAIPYPLSGSPAEVFTDLGPADKSKYRLFRYESAQAYAEYPEGFNTVDRGKGYFIIQAADRNTVVLKMGTQTAPANSRSSLFQLNLHPGWNLIGNPYTTPINWDNVKNYPGNNSSALGTLKVWGSSGYTNVTQLEAFQGAFVNVTGNQTVTIPFLGQTTPGGRTAPEFTTDISKPNWKVQITLRQGNMQNSLGAIGMHPEALEGLDQTDDFNPPAPFDYISLAFPHPEHPLKEFAADIVNTRPEYIWRFYVNAPTDEEAELSWNSSELGNHNIGLYLYDAIQNEVIDMRATSHYTFAPGQTGFFKIYYGTGIQHKIGPDLETLVPPYPNPFSTREPVKFSIGLPIHIKAVSYPVQLSISNSMGQMVYRYAGTLPGGVHTLEWNGLHNGHVAPQGVYLYSLRIGEKLFTGKIYFINQP